MYVLVLVRGGREHSVILHLVPYTPLFRSDVAPRSATRPAPAGHTVTTIHTRPIRHRAPAADTSNIGSGRREPDSGAKSLATDRSVIAPPRTARRKRCQNRRASAAEIAAIAANRARRAPARARSVRARHTWETTTSATTSAAKPAMSVYPSAAHPR